MSKTSTQDSAKPATPKKKGGHRRLLSIIIAVAVVAIGGGGTAAFFATRRPASAAASVKPVQHGLLSLEPYVVNLADEGGSRFLRVTIRLVLEAAEQAEGIQKNEVALMRMRSTILELLTQQTADRVVTGEGKAALKKAIAERAEAVLDGAKVIDVLFSDFVVQF
jgi:flagellar protein FliL